MKLTALPLFGHNFGQIPRKSPAITFGQSSVQPPQDEVVIRKSDGETCDIKTRAQKGVFEHTIDEYNLLLQNEEQSLFAACMHELLFACGLRPDERQHCISTVKTMLRTLDDEFLKSKWFDLLTKWVNPEAQDPFTMGDMALNMMVVYGTPEDVEYCIQERGISPHGMSPVSFHRDYPTPLFRAVDARKPDNIAVLLKYLTPEQLRATNLMGENALGYARFHRSDARTLQMLEAAYREAGIPDSECQPAPPLPVNIKLPYEY